MVKIRNAKTEDSAGLARVQVDSYRTAYAPIFPQSYLDHFTYEEQEQDWREWLIDKPDDVLLVAEMDGEIVGYALGRPGSSEISPYHSELLAAHVRQARQRQGIGSQLIAAVASRLQDQGCRSLILWALAQNPSRALYEKLGGQVVGEKEWGGNEEFGTDVQEVAYGWTDIALLSAIETSR
jgi:GNAT superfamily N-acetyltransferase